MTASKFQTPCVFMTVVEAAEYLRVSKSFLDKLRLRHGGPQYFKVGRNVRYTTKCLDAWTNGQKFSSIGEQTNQSDC